MFIISYIRTAEIVSYSRRIFYRVNCQLRSQAKDEYSSSIAVDMKGMTEAALLLHLPIQLTWCIDMDRLTVVYFHVKTSDFSEDEIRLRCWKYFKEFRPSNSGLFECSAIPEVNLYGIPRKTILQRTGDSEENKLSNIFSDIPIENSTASQILIHLMSLLVPHNLPENIWRWL